MLVADDAGLHLVTVASGEYGTSWAWSDIRDVHSGMMGLRLKQQGLVLQLHEAEDVNLLLVHGIWERQLLERSVAELRSRKAASASK